MDYQAQYEKIKEELEESKMMEEFMTEELNQKDQQVNNLKGELQKRDQEIQLLKGSLNDARNGVVNTGNPQSIDPQLIDDLKAQIQTLNLTLKSESDKFKAQLEEKEFEIEYIKEQTNEQIQSMTNQPKDTQELQALKDSNTKLIAQINDLEQELKSYKEMLEQLKEQNESLNGLLKQGELKDDTIFVLQNQLKSQSDVMQQINQLQKELLANKIIIDDQKLEIEMLHEMQLEAGDKDSIIQNLENKISQLTEGAQNSDILDNLTKQLQEQQIKDQNSIEELNNEILEIQKELQSKESLIKQLQQVKISSEQEILSLQDSIHKFKEELDQNHLQGELLNDLQSEIDQKDSTIEKMNDQLKQQTSQIQTNDQQVQQLNNTISQLKKDNERMKSVESESEEKDQIITHLQSQISQLESQTQSQSQQSDDKSQADTLLVEIELLKKQIGSQTSQIQKLEQDKLQLEKKYEQSSSQIEAQKEEISDLKRSLQETEQLESLLSDMQSEISEKERLIESLKKQSSSKELQQAQLKVTELEQQLAQQIVVIQDLQRQSSDKLKGSSLDMSEYRERIQEKEDIIEEQKEKLQEYEDELKQLADKMSILLTDKQNIQEQMNMAQQKVHLLADLQEENHEIKKLLSDAQAKINHLESNNEYQMLYNQQHEEYEQYKAAAEQMINQNNQDLQMAAQCLEEFETLQTQSKTLENQNTILQGQLSAANERNQQLLAELEQMSHVTFKSQTDIRDVQSLEDTITQLKSDLQALKDKDYAQTELIQNLENRIESIQEREAASPMRINKLQMENSNFKQDFIKLKEESEREIHLLKQEIKNQSSELDAFILLEQDIDNNSLKQDPQQYPRVQSLSKKISDSQQSLLQDLEQQQLMITKLLEEQCQHLAQLSQLTPKDPSQFSNKDTQTLRATLDQEIQTREIQFEDYISSLIPTIKPGKIQISDAPSIVKLRIQVIDIGTDPVQQQQQQQIQNISQEQKASIISQEYKTQQFNSPQQNEVAQEIQQPQNLIASPQQDLIPFEQDYATQKFTNAQQQEVPNELQINIESKSSVIQSEDSSRRKVEDLVRALEKENHLLKSQLRKLEDKRSSDDSRKYSVRNKPSAAEMDLRDTVQRQNKLIKEYEAQISNQCDTELSRELKKIKEEFDIVVFTKDQLQKELDEVRDELQSSKKKVNRLQNELNNIYNLGPQALQALEQPQVIEQPQKIIYEKLRTQNYLYIKSQKGFQSPYLEFNRKHMKFFQQLKGRIEKSVSDSYSFDEIFFDQQKMSQYLELSGRIRSQSLLEGGNKMFLITGQSKTHKKMTLILLIQQLWDCLVKCEGHQSIQIRYEEQLDKNIFTMEELCILETQIKDRESLQDIEFVIQNIKIHLLSKRTRGPGKIRRLFIEHSQICDSQAQIIQKLVFVTACHVPKGEFKDSVQILANTVPNAGYHYYTFSQLMPTLTNYKATHETLQLQKQIRQFKSFEAPSSRFIQAEPQQESEIDKMTRYHNNRLSLKNQELDAYKKQIELFKKQWNEVAFKSEVLTNQSSMIINSIQQVNVEIKNKINVKTVLRKNKDKDPTKQKSNNIQFLEKLVQSLDCLIRKVQPQLTYIDSPTKFKSAASEIVNPFM